MRLLLHSLKIPFQDSRMQCLLKHKDGFFKRESNARELSETQYDITPFPKHVRDQIDSLIDYVNQNVLKKYGYAEMPVHLYAYYRQVKIKGL